MAIKDANQEGGHLGIPFRLVPAWTENPWGTGIAQVARMVYSDDVWAIIGSIDGASTHLVEQVAAKARVTVVNPAATDKTVNLANVPWMFSCLPGDHHLAPILARELAARVKEEAITLVSSTDHDARVFSQELEAAMARRGRGFDFHLHVDESTSELTSIARRIVQTQSKGVVIAAGPRTSARLLISLRESSYRGAVFGGPSMARRAFAEIAGPWGEGAVFPLLAARALSGSFGDRFSRRFGRTPDYASTQTYDATRLLIHAIRQAGLNRARIRDAQAWSPGNDPDARF
jgi:ABC-type branched-subunit amino acid transport system substrate-binding protein